MSQIRQQVINGVRLGQVFSVTRTFSGADVGRFADISRDYNPIHSEERFVRLKGFDGPVCHGLLVASLLTEIGGQLGWLASGMILHFKKPVYFDETIRCDLTITDLSDTGRAKADVVFINEKTEVVLEAILEGILPGPEEKKVLKVMREEGDPTNKVNIKL